MRQPHDAGEAVAAPRVVSAAGPSRPGGRDNPAGGEEDGGHGTEPMCASEQLPFSLGAGN